MPPVKAKIIGFEATEEIAIALINVMRCGSCDKLLNFNGLPPDPRQLCPACKKPIGGDVPV